MLETAPDRGLSRRDRLRNRRDFERLAREGERRASVHFVVFLGCGGRHGRGDPGSRPRLGVTTSRKVGDAVRRNAVKRRIREVFREHRGLLQGAVDVVVIARPGAAALAGREVAEELVGLFASGRR